MKIIFFGLGSIGSRHAHLLRDMGRYDLYTFRSGHNGRGNPLAIPEINGWPEVDALKADVAFITNPTANHIETAIGCAHRGLDLFIEKPIGASVNGLEELLSLVREKKLATYVAYVLRFHPGVKNLKESLLGKKVKSARLVCRSYLPDWRPGADHLKTYSASRAAGGGALLDVSHEFDIVEYLFGPILKISGCLQRRSNVTVDAEDFVEATVHTPSVKAEILIDTASRENERRIHVETDQGDLSCNLLSGVVRDDMYRDQIRYFFEHRQSASMMNDLEEAVPLFAKLIKFRETRL